MGRQRRNCYREKENVKRREEDVEAVRARGHDRQVWKKGGLKEVVNAVLLRN